MRVEEMWLIHQQTKVRVASESLQIWIQFALSFYTLKQQGGMNMQTSRDFVQNQMW